MSINTKRYFDNGLSLVTTLALIAMMVHTVLHALGRSLFQTPITGTNELVAYWYLPVIALLGIPAAQLAREHITVTLIIERMNRGNARAFQVLTALIGFSLSLGFAYFGFVEAMDRMASRSTAGVTQIPTWPVYFLVPIVFGVMSGLFGSVVFNRQNQLDYNDNDHGLQGFPGDESKGAV